MFPSINCEFIDSNNDEILVHSVLIEIFLFSNCFTYVLRGSFRFNLNWIRFVFLPNKIELIASIEFGYGTHNFD